MQQPKSLDKAIELADTFDTTQFQFSKPQFTPMKSFRPIQHQQYKQSNNTPTPMELDNTQLKKKINWDEYRREGKCINCHQKGHIARNCTLANKYPKEQRQ